VRKDQRHKTTILGNISTTIYEFSLINHKVESL